MEVLFQPWYYGKRHLLNNFKYFARLNKMKVLRRGIKKDFCVVVYLRHAGFFNYTHTGESEKISILA